MSEISEQERKKRLAESLLKGERVFVNSSGCVETVEESRNSSGQNLLSIPNAKLASFL